MANRQKKREEDPRTKNLDCFLNQPNINMVVPWIYEIANAMKQRSGEDNEEGGGQDGEEDKIAESLDCFLNQPNINMTIPWIYQIYKSVKSGGGGGGGGGDDPSSQGLIWDESEE
jgi:hypothetical protein